MKNPKMNQEQLFELYFENTSALIEDKWFLDELDKLHYSS